jgi:hypothetical protein
MNFFTKLICSFIATATFFFPFSVTSFAQTDSQPDTEVTPLQLRVMQTRKFLKSPNEVIGAIKTNMEDAGASQCTIQAIQYEPDGSQTAGSGQVKCYFNPKIGKGPDTGAATALAFVPFVGGLLSSAKMSSDLKAQEEEQEKQLREVSYEIVAPRASKETTVRMRIMTGLREPKQSSIPDMYAKRFKLIGDSLFIQAIPIQGAVQQ